MKQNFTLVILFTSAVLGWEVFAVGNGRSAQPTPQVVEETPPSQTPAAAAEVNSPEVGDAQSVQCMSDVLGTESDGSEAGMYDVGAVVMKRVEEGQGTICQVVHAHGQFVGLA